MTNPRPAEQDEPIVNESTAETHGLSPEQETFLFGDQGPMPDEDVAYDVWGAKMHLARLWLASFVSLDSIEDHYYKYLLRMSKELRRDYGEQIDMRVTTITDIAYAIHMEQNEKGNFPLSERSLFWHALESARMALSDDPEIDQKLKYIGGDEGLFAEYDRKSWNSGRHGGDVSATRFPVPVESYRGKPYPIQLANTGMLI